jgi:hypothetical protein
MQAEPLNTSEQQGNLVAGWRIVARFLPRFANHAAEAGI